MLSAPRRTAGFVTACSYFWDVSLVSTKMFEKEGTAVSRQAVGGPRRHKLLVQRMSLVCVKDNRICELPVCNTKWMYDADIFKNGELACHWTTLPELI